MSPAEMALHQLHEARESVRRLSFSTDDDEVLDALADAGQAIEQARTRLQDAREALEQEVG